MIPGGRIRREFCMRRVSDFQLALEYQLRAAVQYVNENGTIGLHLEKKRQKARILLRNSVDALPDCPPEALFDRFYRGDSARTQSGGGYGIGLSAAQAICEMHGGRISAAYEGEHRICFMVELPLRT